LETSLHPCTISPPFLDQDCFFFFFNMLSDMM
jgi:hypothetical protein